MFVKLKKIGIQENQDGFEIITDWENELHHSTIVPKECDCVGLKNALIQLCGRVMNDPSLRNKNVLTIEQENNE